MIDWCVQEGTDASAGNLVAPGLVLLEGDEVREGYVGMRLDDVMLSANRQTGGADRLDFAGGRSVVSHPLWLSLGRRRRPAHHRTRQSHLPLRDGFRRSS